MTTEAVATFTPVDDDFAPPPPAPLEKTYFGEVVILDSWNCILQSGVGKVRFDPSQHEAYRKKKAITIKVECQTRDGGTYTVDQDTISDSKEWRITYPSITGLGLMVPQLKGKFVQVKRVPTGEYYTNKATNEQKPKTTLKFIAAYPDRDAMKAAADVFYTPKSERVGDWGHANDDRTVAQIAAEQRAAAPTAPTPAAAPVADIGRDQAATLLPFFWTTNGQDKSKFYGAVKTNPVTAPHFSDHKAPEMLAYLGDDFDPNVPF